MRTHADDNDEAPFEPLSSSYSGDNGPSHSRDAQNESLLPDIKRTESPRHIITVVFIVVFVLNFGSFLMQVPIIRLFEDIICHHHYSSIEKLGDISEGRCKIVEVQEELNTLLAVLLFLSAIPSLVTTIPYGLVADRIGRKPVFMLSIIGIIAMQCWSLIVVRCWKWLPLKLIWVGPMFMLVGGGEAVADMMFFAIGSDITTDEQRSNFFLAGQCVSLLSELIAPSIASGLMAKSPWIPILLGLFLMICGTALSSILPETLTMRLGSNHIELPPTPTAPLFKRTSIVSAVKDQFKTSFHHARESTTIFNFPILLLILGFVIQPFSRQAIDLSIRYISTRYHWTLAHAGFLLSLRAGTNFFLLLIAIPTLSNYLTHKHFFSSKSKDLLLARFSVLILIIGSLLIGLAPSPGTAIGGLVIWTLGTGFVPLLRSLITMLVDAQLVGRLYATIAIVETIGSLLAGPSLAGLFTAGLRLKGRWIGLPFLGLAGIIAVAGVGVWTFRNRDEDGYGAVGEDDRVGGAMVLEDGDED